MNSLFAPLTDRRLLALTGPDRLTFLQGLCTQNCLKLTPGVASLALHLTPQGRFLYDFFIIPQPEMLWLDVHAPTAMAFARQLYSYKMRYDIEFHDLGDDYHIYAQTPAQPLAGPGLSTPDPRHPGLGSRLYLPTRLKPATTHTLADYQALRLGLGIPDGAYDCFPDKTFPNEYCFADLGGIDYKKGCYLGQELTARTHFVTQPKKYLMQVSFTGPAPAQGTEVLRGNLKVGTMLSSYGEQGLALLRLSEVAKGEPLMAGQTRLTPHKPAWASYAYPPQET